MKESKAIYVTKRDPRDNTDRIFSNGILNDKEISSHNEKSRDVGCQFDSKRDNVICTCKNVLTVKRKDIKYFSGLPKQIYTYHGSRSYTDVGVGSVKALQRKKVKRIYLPATEDRGAGSEDLTLFISRITKHNKEISHYDHKRTSSKCVGGIIEYNTGCVMSEKLSPVIQTRFRTTSPMEPSIDGKNTEIGSNTVGKKLITATTQVETEFIGTSLEVKQHVIDTIKKDVVSDVKVNAFKAIEKNELTMNRKKSTEKQVKLVERAVSSDSLVQHVHNLENPSEDRQSHMSVDVMENKLEREYRKMFATKDKDKIPSIEKPLPDLKSTSLLKRRFEALRRGLSKKQEAKKKSATVKTSSQMSTPSKRDVSIASDPPSLEARSYSITKTYSPFPFNTVPDKEIYDPSASQRISISRKKYRDSSQWSQLEEEGSDYQGVKGMFKLWGEKFNLEEECYKKKATPIPSFSKLRQFQPVPGSDVKKSNTKVPKDSKKFFFFKRKNKEKAKAKQPYKPKKGLTAGRCEIKDGLTIKIGANAAEEEKKKSEDKPQKLWLEKYLSRATESRNSVQIRWNNKTYATSSSTVFELMDTVYKETGVVFRSRSDISNAESSLYKSYTHHVNFAHQEIEAWMIPKTITDRPKQLPVKIKNKSNDNIEVRISDQKWFIDKSKAFSHKIEVVLHSKKLVKPNKEGSSEYLRIDIPKGFFIHSSSDYVKENQSSDEEVYKIVEYETEADYKKNNIENNLETGDHMSNDLKVIVNVKDSKDFESTTLLREVDIQGSNVNIPKRCDVIGVGIITQRDLREISKPIWKVQEDISDEEEVSEQELHQTSKKCEFAESFLQDYYRRHWTPLGIDLFSWCVSDSHLRCCSENSRVSFNNQRDGSKSCPNIYDDFQASTIISSNEPCRPCHPCTSKLNEEEDEKPESSFSTKFFQKFKPKIKDLHDCCKRVLPKDSLEVFRKRQIYALSNKSKWARPSYGVQKPPSIPSIDTECNKPIVEFPTPKKSCCKSSEAKPKKKICKKHVSMPDCDTINELLVKQLSDKPTDGILAFKGAAGCDACRRTDNQCPKHAKVDPKESCEIPLPPCTNKCKNDPHPPCDSLPSAVSRESKKKECIPKLKCQPQLPECPSSLKGELTPPSSPPQKPTYPKHRCQPPCPDCLSSPTGELPPPTSPPQKPSCPKHNPCKTSRPTKSSPKNSCLGCKVTCLKPSPNPTSPKEETCNIPPCKIRCLEPSPGRIPSSSPLSSACKTTCSSKLDPRKKQDQSPPIKPCPPTAMHSKKNSTIKKPSPLCPHFPPCKKSQSSQISPDPGSPRNTPPVSPPRSPKNKSKKNSACKVPPCNTKKKEKKKPPPPPSKCNTPPCQKTSPPPSDDGCKEFPWPIDNQVSNQPSLESEAGASPPKKCKDANKCIKNCPLSPNYSGQTIAPKVNKDKTCKPDCANRPKQLTHPPPQPNPSPPPPPACSPPAPRPGTTKSKISGLFLKMKPSKKKTCAEECLAWNEQEKLEGVIRLNSKEKISIRLKDQTPSTEEIRAGMNVKVQDEDGQTLFERRDYTNQCGKHRPSVLGDMYKTSNINRVSTPITVKNIQTTQETDHNEVTEIKSDGSIANLIEIQFKLRVTQGEKTTEIDIGNENEKHTKKNELSPSPREVYVLKDNDDHQNDENPGPKNDVNIKIVIKNYKHKTERSKIDKCEDEFTKNISDKFQTVSTGYSDMCAGQNPENVFSVHRTTIDLRSSIETCRTQSLAKLSQETGMALLDQYPIKHITASHNTEPSWESSVHKTDDKKVEEKLTSSKKHSRFDTQDLKSDINGYRIKAADTDNVIDTNLNSFESAEVADKSINKKEKKEILKKIFEKANRMKTKDKERMKQLRDMLKVILTSDSSCHEEIAVTSNELAKDVTYASLKPNYFRDTDSMNNYYKIDSNASSGNESRSKKYPTEENNSVCSKSDEISSDNEIDHGCVCSALAERLNLSNIGGGCCCRNAAKMNEETNCDLRNDNDNLLLNLKTTELVDIETQNSKYLSSKVNSTNVSMYNRKKSSLRHPSTLVAHVEDTSCNFGNKEDINIKDCEKKLSHNKILTMSDDDNAVLFDAETIEVAAEYKNENKHVKKRINNDKSNMVYPTADILQSYETKKAVLEIYAEKSMTNGDERLVARLPKFVFEKESEVRRSYNKLTNYRSVCKKNIVMMSIQR